MTTTANCRVSFIDLYLVFPRNFRMVFLPHTNTVILLEPYCCTTTEPGLSVVSLEFQLAGWNDRKGKKNIAKFAVFSHALTSIQI